MRGDDQDQLLTVKEAAERLHVHPMTVRRQIKAGLLPAVRVGRAVRVREVDLAAYVGSQAGYEINRPDTEMTIVRDAAVLERPAVERQGKGGGEMRHSYEKLLPNSGAGRAEWFDASRRELEWQMKPTAAELKLRSEIIDRMRERRAKMKPLGISTTQLIREGRDELDDRTGRHAGLGG